MIGYHYTSLANWKTIREQGLRPYLLRRDIVADCVPGVWLWVSKQHGTSHAGCILFQIKTKKTFDVVELEVDYEPAWCERVGWENCRVMHEGKVTDDFGELIGYYHRKAEAVISWRPVMPERIKLVGQYSFSQAWERADQLGVGLTEQSNVRKFDAGS
jgi:hypothetical protein